MNAFHSMIKTFQMAFDSRAPSLSPSFVLPDIYRPNLKNVSQSASCIPIVDLQLVDQSLLVRQVSEACKKLGFFRVINHGIPHQLCDAVLDTVTQFFHLPPEHRRQYLTTDHKKKVKIFNYDANVENRKIKMWSETFTLPWDPEDQEYLDRVPENPCGYREVYGEYAREMGRVMDRVLGLMSLGLGLEEGSLKNSIGHNPELYSQANYYPPCPNPELTMGLGAHTDIVAIAVLLQTQGPAGLQILKDNQWVSVHPIPNSLIINLADQMQILSNGKYKSVVHRAVTNSEMARVSMVMFYAPNDATVIKPIEELTDQHHPPIYTSFTYGQFMQEFYASEGKRRAVNLFRSPTN